MLFFFFYTVYLQNLAAKQVLEMSVLFELSS
jgi:hypothetical protein